MQITLKVLSVMNHHIIVANQLNILIPVGTAIINVAAVKYALVSTSKPTLYIWCDFILQNLIHQ